MEDEESYCAGDRTGPGGAENLPGGMKSLFEGPGDGQSES